MAHRNAWKPLLGAGFGVCNIFNIVLFASLVLLRMNRTRLTWGCCEGWPRVRIVAIPGEKLHSSVWISKRVQDLSTQAKEATVPKVRRSLEASFPKVEKVGLIFLFILRLPL